jgi:hypothetical protein
VRGGKGGCLSRPGELDDLEGTPEVPWIETTCEDLASHHSTQRGKGLEEEGEDHSRHRASRVGV